MCLSVCLSLRMCVCVCVCAYVCVCVERHAAGCWMLAPRRAESRNFKSSTDAQRQLRPACGTMLGGPPGRVRRTDAGWLAGGLGGLDGEMRAQCQQCCLHQCVERGMGGGVCGVYVLLYVCEW